MAPRAKAQPNAIEIPHPVPERLAALIADRFAVLAEPMRIRLLDSLRDGPASVSKLVDLTGSSQQNVSKHLAVLRGAGMVSKRKDGNRSCYSISDHSVFMLCESVCGSLRRHLDELDTELEEILGPGAQHD